MHRNCTHLAQTCSHKEVNIARGNIVQILFSKAGKKIDECSMVHIAGLRSIRPPGIFKKLAREFSKCFSDILFCLDVYEVKFP